MAVLKLNEEKMAKNNKKKPTNQDFIDVINGILQELSGIKDNLGALTGAFDMYVEYNGNGKEFQSFIQSKFIDPNIKKEEDELQATEQDNPVADKANSSD